MEANPRTMHFGISMQGCVGVCSCVRACVYECVCMCACVCVCRCECVIARSATEFFAFQCGCRFDVFVYIHLHTNSCFQIRRYLYIHVDTSRYMHTGWCRRIRHLILIGYFPPKIPLIIASFAERDLQLETSYASSPPLIYV